MNDLFNNLPDFIRQGSPEFLQHFLVLIGADQQAAALISSDLRTLDTTSEAARILGRTSFQSLFDILSPEACRMAQSCLENQSILKTTDTVDGLPYQLTFYPLEQKLFLLLQPVKQDGVSLSDDFFCKYKIQNSLSNIYMASRALSAQEPEAITKYSQMIQKNVLQVIRFQNHNEILSPAFTGQRLRLQAGDAAVLIRRIGGHAQSALQKQDRQLHLSAPDTLVAAFDLRLLSMAIYNLLANSILYTQGAVSLALSQHGNQVQIRIADQGKGLSDSVKETLQQAALSVPPSPASLTVGRGIALARKIAQLHAGNLLSSQSEDGFSMVLSFSQSLSEQGKFSQTLSSYGVSADPYPLEDVELFSLL